MAGHVAQRALVGGMLGNSLQTPVDELFGSLALDAMGDRLPKGNIFAGVLARSHRSEIK